MRDLGVGPLVVHRFRRLLHLRRRLWAALAGDDLQLVARIDPVRILDVRVEAPDLRPVPGVVEKLLRQVPQRVALLDDVDVGRVGADLHALLFRGAGHHQLAVGQLGLHDTLRARLSLRRGLRRLFPRRLRVLLLLDATFVLDRSFRLDGSFLLDARFLLDGSFHPARPFHPAGALELLGRRMHREQRRRRESERRGAQARDGRRTHHCLPDSRSRLVRS